MGDEILVVVCRVNVEAVPDVAEHDCATETIALDACDVIKSDAAQGHHFAVNPALCGVLLQHFVCEGRFVTLFGDAVENRAEQDIVAHGFLRFDLFDGVTRAADVSFVSGWRFGVALVQVYAHELILIFQVEVVMYHDAFPVTFGYEREQSLGIDGLCAGLTQMQDLQPFVEERCKYLVLLDEEVGHGHQNQLHSVCHVLMATKLHNLTDLSCRGPDFFTSAAVFLSAMY